MSAVAFGLKNGAKKKKTTQIWCWKKLKLGRFGANIKPSRASVLLIYHADGINKEVGYKSHGHQQTCGWYIIFHQPGFAEMGKSLKHGWPPDWWRCVRPMMIWQFDDGMDVADPAAASCPQLFQAMPICQNRMQDWRMKSTQWPFRSRWCLTLYWCSRISRSLCALLFLHLLVQTECDLLNN